MIFEEKIYEIQVHNGAFISNAEMKVLGFTKTRKSIKILISFPGGQCFRRTVKIREDSKGEYVVCEDVLKNVKIRPERKNGYQL